MRHSVLSSLIQPDERLQTCSESLEDMGACIINSPVLVFIDPGKQDAFLVNMRQVTGRIAKAVALNT